MHHAAAPPDPRVQQRCFNEEEGQQAGAPRLGFRGAGGCADPSDVAGSVARRGVGSTPPAERCRPGRTAGETSPAVSTPVDARSVGSFRKSYLWLVKIETTMGDLERGITGLTVIKGTETADI